ncbi:hypothetical protein [Jannaschia sp. W003]|uniref:hypothetical protein n=1 Tax=Jannaschia sp. W003 TaxID=2867012 RepID=UPI0021A6177E|nr:hypothetical protein [Jannaschia sp. W003]UWQ22363.1 hypothetical protein K3554_04825 [Jannaschia sp. W003]
MIGLWWVWALGAVALLVVEVLVPGHVALGFAIGAGLVALGLLSGLLGAALPLAGGAGGALLLVAFAALSLVAWLGLRAVLGAPGRAETFEDDVND